MKMFLIGFMGSGKSHWGSLLATRLQLPFFDLDAIITEREQRTITEIFEQHGEEHFRYREREVLESIAENNTEFILSCGGGTPCFFNNIQYMKKKGRVIWLNTGIDTLVLRLLKDKKKRPVLSNIDDAELRSFIMKKILGRKMYYEQADIVVQEESLSVDTFAEIIANA